MKPSERRTGCPTTPDTSVPSRTERGSGAPARSARRRSRTFWLLLAFGSLACEFVSVLSPGIDLPTMDGGPFPGSGGSSGTGGGSTASGGSPGCELDPSAPGCGTAGQGGGGTSGDGLGGSAGEAASSTTPSTEDAAPFVDDSTPTNADEHSLINDSQSNDSPSNEGGGAPSTNEEDGE